MTVTRTHRPAWPCRLRRASPQAAGLRLWVPGEPRGGRAAWDLSGWDHHGTLVGPPVATLGPAGGRSLSFDAATTYVDFGAPRGLERYDNFSVAVWCYHPADSSGTEFALAKDFSTGNRGWCLGVFQQQVYLEAGGGGVVQELGPDLTDDAWHLLAATCRGGNWSVYLDGELVGTGSQSLTANPAAHWYLGGRSYVGFFNGWNGWLAEPRVWARVLTAPEVGALWQPRTRWELYEPLIQGRFSTGSQTFARSLSDTLAVTDAMTRLAHGNRSFSSTLGTTDALARLAHGNRVLADAAAAAEAYARLAHGLRAYSDTASGSDAFQRLAHAIRAYADTLALADSEAATVAFNRPLSESFALSDAFARLADAVRSLTDTLALSDAYQRLAQGSRSLADTLAASEAYARLAHGNRSHSDPLAGAEAYQRLAHGLRSFADTLGLDDVLALQALVPGVLTLVVVDTLAAAEAYQRLAHGNRSLSDTLASADALARLVVALRAYADTLAAMDVYQRQADALRATTDVLGSSEAYARLASALRTVAETTAGSESYQRLAHSNRSFTDTLAASDLASLLLVAANLVYGVPVLEAGVIDIPGLERGEIELPGLEQGAFES